MTPPPPPHLRLKGDGDNTASWHEAKEPIHSLNPVLSSTYQPDLRHSVALLYFLSYVLLPLPAALLCPFHFLS